MKPNCNNLMSASPILKPKLPYKLNNSRKGCLTTEVFSTKMVQHSAVSDPKHIQAK